MPEEKLHRLQTEIGCWLGRKSGTKRELLSLIGQLEDGLKLHTIKVYLSPVQFLHISEGRDDPFAPSCLRLGYILQGVIRQEAEAGSEKRERLPISPGILGR